MKQTRVNKYIKTLKPKRLRQQAAGIYYFYLRNTPPEQLRLALLKSIMKPMKQVGTKDYLWEKLIEKYGQDKVEELINTLADLADGKKRMRKSK